MNNEASRYPTFLMTIAPAALVITGGAVVWTFLAGIIPPLPALLLNCTLGVMGFVMGYLDSKFGGNHWISLLNTFVLLIGVNISFKVLYPSPDNILAGVQVVAMVMLVFFGLLRILKGRWDSRIYL